MTTSLSRSAPEVDALAEQLRLAREECAQMQVALLHSRQIGPAIGILMSTRKLTYDAAFQQLRVASQHHNRKLHDIALDVVETGELTLSTPGC